MRDPKLSEILLGDVETHVTDSTDDQSPLSVADTALGMLLLFCAVSVIVVVSALLGQYAGLN